MSDVPDGLISGRYRLGTLLGSGGSASVFAATDVDTGRLVAVKILHPHLVGSAADRRAFLAEARAAMIVRGPNVVEVLDAGTRDAGENSLAWIVMQLAPGESLAELVGRRGPLGVSQALAMAEGVLCALEAAHAAGVLHRDISPGNVMVAPGPDGDLTAGDVHLVDFGIAAATTAGAALEVRGNAGYVSPEQAAGGLADERGDLYQLGGVLYFALVGRAPYSRNSTAAVLEAHRFAPPPVPSVSRPALPRAVDRLVVRALLKHPDDRYSSASEMRRAVREAAREVRESRGGQATVDGQVAAESGERRTMLLADGRTTVIGAAVRPAPGVPMSAPRKSALRNSAATGSRLRGGAGWVAPLVIAALVASAWALASTAPSSPAARNATAQNATESPTVTPVATAPPDVASGGSSSMTARVPDLERMSLDDARAALATVGLAVGNLVVQDSPFPGDTVLGAWPGPGAVLALGATVDLLVASGSNPVPAVVGLSQREGVSALEAAGFAAVVRNAAEGGATPWVVTGSDPAERTVLRIGEEVVLVVAPHVVDPSPVPTAGSVTPDAPSPSG